MIHQIYNGDNIAFMRAVAPLRIKFDCVFADPPDNIDLGYDECYDRLEAGAYASLCHQWIRQALNVSDQVWWSFNSRHTPMMGSIVQNIILQGGREEDFNCHCSVQTFTFGNHQRKKPTDNHRPLWFITRGKPVFNEVKVPSWREQNGDKRAKPGGKMCGNVMDERSTVFDVPRVTGNSKQRRSWHPTQLSEKLVERALLLSTKEGDSVLDPFGGTGTTLRVCEQLQRHCTYVDMSSSYCEQVANEHSLSVRRVNDITYDDR